MKLWGKLVYEAKRDWGWTYCQHVQDADYHCQDSSRGDNTPERHADFLLGHCFCVQIAKCRDAQDHHDSGKGVEARFLTEHWPVVVEVVLQNWEFGDDQEDCYMLVEDHRKKRVSILTANQSHHRMGYSLEEKEAVQHIDFDQHDRTSSDEVEKGDNIENANCIQDHVPWTSQGLTQTSHHDVKRKKKGYRGYRCLLADGGV